MEKLQAVLDNHRAEPERMQPIAESATQVRWMERCLYAPGAQGQQVAGAQSQALKIHAIQVHRVRGDTVEREFFFHLVQLDQVELAGIGLLEGIVVALLARFLRLPEFLLELIEHALDKGLVVSLEGVQRVIVLVTSGNAVLRRRREVKQVVAEIQRERPQTIAYELQAARVEVGQVAGCPLRCQAAAVECHAQGARAVVIEAAGYRHVVPIAERAVEYCV